MWLSSQLPWNAPSGSNQHLIVFEPAQEAPNHSSHLPVQGRNQVHGRNSPLQVLLSRILLTPRGLCVPLSAPEQETTGQISKQQGRMNGRPWGQRPVSPSSCVVDTLARGGDFIYAAKHTSCSETVPTPGLPCWRERGRAEPGMGRATGGWCLVHVPTSVGFRTCVEREGTQRAGRVPCAGDKVTK